MNSEIAYLGLPQFLGGMYKGDIREMGVRYIPRIGDIEKEIC